MTLRPATLAAAAALWTVVPALSSAPNPEPETPSPTSRDPMPDEFASPHARPPLPSAEALRSLPPDGGPDYNRLVFSQSPYLLQHAANPVDWHPWGEEAFERARAEDKPVFLSIGYSTCHWCHVMERESFEDEEVAALMNRDFICVKVDREERPDVDKIYMDVTQALTGSGGWPMTVILTPDQKPFFAGTYFPKHGRFGRPGMLDLLPQLAEAWRGQREQVLESADQITQHVVDMNRGRPGNELDPDVMATAFQQLAERFDATRGGFGRAPKFPTPHQLSFLLRHGQRTGDARAADMAARTLTAMRLGGIYDHVGFGFHRYSTDANWLLPHFEKMLYDQALLALAYLDGFQATGDPLFAETAHEIFTYVLRDMTDPAGGFYSAEDADSEDVEGKFYLWRADELREVLGEEEAAWFMGLFGCREEGNFTPEGSEPGGPDNIPHRTRSWTRLAEAEGSPVRELRSRADLLRQRLFDAREKRVHPLKDDKILTDWNGLMIAALARGARVLDEPTYRDAARQAADFALSTLRTPEGRLLKRSRGGRAGLPAHLDDYAFLIWGLLELYQTTFDIDHLREAAALTEVQLAHFWDDAGGGFFLTADDGETLLVRAKEVYDGATPSGNSVSALNLLRLARLTGRAEYEDRARSVFRAFGESISAQPVAYTQMMIAVDFAAGPAYEVVVAGDRDAADTRRMLSALHGAFLPRLALHLRDDAQAGLLAETAPYTEAMAPIGDAATAYVCQDFSCRQPTTDLAEMLGHLGLDPE